MQVEISKYLVECNKDELNETSIQNLNAMMRIVMVADDLEINGMTGTCGKSGQSKAVGVGQPTVKFSELTVGGTGM